MPAFPSALCHAVLVSAHRIGSPLYVKQTRGWVVIGYVFEVVPRPVLAALLLSLLIITSVSTQCVNRVVTEQYGRIYSASDATVGSGTLELSNLQPSGTNPYRSIMRSPRFRFEAIRHERVPILIWTRGVRAAN